MAWTERLPSGHWRAAWRDQDGKKHGLSRDPATKQPFTREAAALRIAGEQETKARRGLATDDGRGPTWNQWCEVWLAARRVETSTTQADMVKLERYLRPQWGARRLATITRPQVQAWVNELSATPTRYDQARTLAPSTVDKIFRLFSASMKAATADDRLPLSRNPCVGVKLPHIAPGHERYLTREEVDLIAYHLSGRWRAAWLLLCGTGLRFGELAGLHWQRVHDGQITVIETWDPADQTIKPYPKSRKPRSVPIAPWVQAVLDDLEPTTGQAKSCGQKHSGGVRCRSGLVVPAPRGGPLSGHRFGKRQFADAVAAAGLDPLRLHDARHSFASWLRQNGVALEEVQRLLGHASILTTQRYAHLGTSQNERVLAALS